jgi:hypothetical protein
MNIRSRLQKLKERVAASSYGQCMCPIDIVRVFPADTPLPLPVRPGQLAYREGKP